MRRIYRSGCHRRTSPVTSTHRFPSMYRAPTSPLRFSSRYGPLSEPTELLAPNAFGVRIRSDRLPLRIHLRRGYRPLAPHNNDSSIFGAWAQALYVS